MIRGTTHFTCNDCGNTFQALDIDYGATIFSVPQKCPKCESMHSYPFTFLGILNRDMYIKIWRKMDKQNNKH